MEMTTHAATRRYLLLGLIASVITVLGGELPIGWTVYPTIENDPAGMLGMLEGSGNLTLAQLFCGVLFGGLFIPLQYFGFEGCARLVREDGCRRAAGFIHFGALATGFFGGIVHVMCVALMFICRLADFTATTAIPQPVMDFALWLVLPVSAVFMPVYYAMCIVLLITMASGKTRFHRWAALLNPLTVTLSVNLLPMIVPGSPLVNALGMANMGLGSVLTFGGLLLLSSRPKPI